MLSSTHLFVANYSPASHVAQSCECIHKNTLTNQSWLADASARAVLVKIHLF